MSQVRSPGDMLRAFHEKYDLGIEDQDFSNEEHRFNREEITSEEYNEYLMEMDMGNDPENCLKEICDAVVTLVGACTRFGWDFDRAFRLVMESNMTKGNKDGSFSKKEGGKLAKGLMYRVPDLKDCV